MSSLTATSISLADLAQACRFGRLSEISEQRGIATGCAELDAALPLAGWPIGAVTEIMYRTEGIGELKLVTSALAQLTREQRYIAFVAPPYLPYPPALVQHGVLLERVLTIHSTTPADLLWSMEQCLRCSAFGAVLAWPTHINDRELRRLQLAAETGKNLAIVYRPLAAAFSSSPAALRLCLHAHDDELKIEIKKCRGGRAGQTVSLKRGADDIPAQRAA